MMPKSPIPKKIRQQEYARNWIERNKHKVKYKIRRYKATSKWAKRNRDKVNETRREWCKKYPQKIAHIRARRYAREQGAVGSHTLDEWLQMKKVYNYKCAICGELKERLTKDHIVPLSKGGTDYIENIQPLCRSCNSRKKDR